MPKMDNSSDERLLWLKFLNGEDQVLSLIYLHYSSSLFDYGCRFTKDSDLVKDCIQEVFCNLLRTRKNLSETDNVKFYLLKSLKRKIFREIQSSGKKLISISDKDYSFELMLHRNVDEHLNELDEARQQALAEALNSLTERQKEAIYLRFNRGLEYEEISVMLNLNYQSARALIHRAIEKLREVIHIQEEKITQVLFSIFVAQTKPVF